MALAEPSALPRPIPLLAAPRIRRCTFRRVTAVERRRGSSYEVDCLFPDRAVPMPLGDIERAMSVCNSCSAVGIFRADED